jgi:hypothetical protein
MSAHFSFISIISIMEELCIHRDGLDSYYSSSDMPVYRKLKKYKKQSLVLLLLAVIDHRIVMSTHFSFISIISIMEKLCIYRGGLDSHYSSSNMPAYSKLQYKRQSLVLLLLASIDHRIVMSTHISFISIISIMQELCIYRDGLDSHYCSSDMSAYNKLLEYKRQSLVLLLLASIDHRIVMSTHFSFISLILIVKEHYIYPDGLDSHYSSSDIPAYSKLMYKRQLLILLLLASIDHRIVMSTHCSLLSSISIMEELCIYPDGLDSYYSSIDVPAYSKLKYKRQSLVLLLLASIDHRIVMSTHFSFISLILIMEELCIYRDGLDSHYCSSDMPAYC